MSSPVATRAAAPGAAPPADSSVESVDRILQRACDHLGLDVAFVAEVTVDGKRLFRHVVADGDGPAPVVGGYDPLDQTYCGMILDGSLPEVTPDTREVPALQALPVTAALGIGCYLGVPIELPDGAVYGTLCAYGRSAEQCAQRPGRRHLALPRHTDRRADRVGHAVADRVAGGFDRVTELLGGDRLHIVWQPIVDLASGRAVGYEALSRFAVEPALAPDVAFAMAARVGLGVELELRAAAEALGRLAELPQTSTSRSTSAPRRSRRPLRSAPRRCAAGARRRGAHRARERGR
jgi:hypothetical protein